MRSSWRIARIIGIDISIDLSWFIIVFLMVYTLGFVEFPRELHPFARVPRPDAMSISLGIITSLLLFASVLAHELSHSWMAIQHGIRVKGITLFIFGGVAQIAQEPDRPATEFLIAIMGPLMSVALAALFGGLWVWLQILESTQIIGQSLMPLVLLSGILFQTNGSLAIFNLAPGFPLDGGRVLRSILWALSRNLRRATFWATRVGQLIAVTFFLIGGFSFFVQANGNGLWFALIGMFLWNAAGESYHQTVMLETLRGVTVNQLMTRVFATVPAQLSIAELVDQYILPRRDQTFAVTDSSGSATGIITLSQIQGLPRDQWMVRRVVDVMKPIAQIQALDQNQTLAAALTRLSNSDVEELPVLEAGQIVGFLGQGEIARFLKLKSDYTKN